MLAFVTMVLAAEPSSSDLVGTWDVHRRELARTTCGLDRVMAEKSYPDVWTIAIQADGKPHTGGSTGGRGFVPVASELVSEDGASIGWLIWSPGRMVGEELETRREGSACSILWRLELRRR